MIYTLDEKCEVLNDNTFNHFLDCQRRVYGLYLEDVKSFPEASKLSFESWSTLPDAVDVVRECWSEFRELFSGRPGESFERAFHVCRAIYNNHKSRSARLRHKIEKWNSIGSLYFLTLTFSPEAMERSSDDSRRQAVRRYLSDLGILFCANVDYGDQNEREHYHAVICSPEDLPGSWKKDKGQMFLVSPFFESWAQSYGYYNLQRIRLDPETCDSRRISKYISKLTNHALKKSASGSRFVCNRKFPSWAKERGL